MGGDPTSTEKHSCLTYFYDNNFIRLIECALTDAKATTVVRNGKQVYAPDYSGVTLNSLIVSDTLVLWTSDDSLNSFFGLVRTIGKLMNDSFAMGAFALRGAVSSGPITFRYGRYPTSVLNVQATVFGQPLVEASRLEKAQEWAGCIVARECMKKVFDNLGLLSPPLGPDDLEQARLLTKYEVPFAAAEQEASDPEYYAVIWPFFIPEGCQDPYRSEIERAFRGVSATISDRARRKMENTVRFVDHLSKLRLWPPRINDHGECS